MGDKEKAPAGVRQEPPRSTLEAGVLGLSLQDVTIETAAVEATLNFTGTVTRPLVPPICHASTYCLDKTDDFLGALGDGGFVYSRNSNLTQDSVECAINVLEQGAGSLVFSSGMAALSAIFFGNLQAGDHVVHQNPIYSGTLDLLKFMSKNFKIELSMVKAGSPVEEFKKQVKSNTKIIIGETPCNPIMDVLDLKGFGELSTSLGDGVLTVVDSTFASPYLQNPIKYGVDIVMHSCTKYMGGHSDLLAGSATTRTLGQWRKLKKMQSCIGSCLSPHDCSLLLRGLRTLPIRMVKHSENAQKIAEFLSTHPKVVKTIYPGLPSHPGHEIAKRQMKSFGGMIALLVAGGAKGGDTFVQNVKIARLAVSLGGVQTIVEHAYSMTHGPYLMTEQETLEAGIFPGMIRLSVGIEDADDLIKDLRQALDKIVV